MAFLDENGVAQLWAAIKSHVTTVSDTLLSDIGDLLDTKFDKNKVVANYTTQVTGCALDASLGRAIKAKMDLADTLDTKLSNIGSILLSEASVSAAPGQYTNITAVTIPANSGTWLVFGNVVWADITGNTPVTTARIVSSPTTDTKFLQGRTSATYGGGVNAWGYVTNYTGARVITLQTYGYVSDTFTATGYLLAIRIK